MSILIYEGLSGSGKTTRIENLCGDTLERINIVIKPFTRHYATEVYHSLSELTLSKKPSALLDRLHIDLTISMDYVNLYHDKKIKILEHETDVLAVFDRLFISPVCLYEAYSRYWGLKVENLIWLSGGLYFEMLKKFEVDWNIFMKQIKPRQLSFDRTGRITKMFHENYWIAINKYGLDDYIVTR